MRNLLMAIAVIIIIAGVVWFVKGRQVQSPTITEEVKCPVTGEKVNPATAKLKTAYKGKTYYFCCPGCPEEFKKNPEKYIKK